MLGFEGSDVLTRRYCSSKIKGAADVSKRISPFDLRMTLNENGESTWTNSSAELFDDTEVLLSGVGKTLVGTVYAT